MWKRQEQPIGYVNAIVGAEHIAQGTCLRKGKITRCSKCKSKAAGDANRIDLTEKVFNRLTVISIHGKTKNRQTLWLCKCYCGEEVIARTDALLTGTTKSCGCYHSEDISQRRKAKLIGQRFGRLVVKHMDHQNHVGCQVWECLCDCGKTTFVTTHALKTKHTRSCGCYGREVSSEIMLRWMESSSNRPYISKSAALFLDNVEKCIGRKIEREVRLSRRLFDGQVGNVVIEVDSDYWHNNVKQKKIDVLKNDIAKKHGYRMFRFTVNELQEIPTRLKQYQDDFRKLKEVM